MHVIFVPLSSPNQSNSIHHLFLIFLFSYFFLVPKLVILSRLDDESHEFSWRAHRKINENKITKTTTTTTTTSRGKRKKKSLTIVWHGTAHGTHMADIHPHSRDERYKSFIFLFGFFTKDVTNERKKKKKKRIEMGKVDKASIQTKKSYLSATTRDDWLPERSKRNESNSWWPDRGHTSKTVISNSHFLILNWITNLTKEIMKKPTTISSWRMMWFLF